MTFKEWLEGFYADAGGWESEYSGNIKALEAAWNAAVRQSLVAGENAADLISTEFGSEEPV